MGNPLLPIMQLGLGLAAAAGVLDGALIFGPETGLKPVGLTPPHQQQRRDDHEGEDDDGGYDHDSRGVHLVASLRSIPDRARPQRPNDGPVPTWLPRREKWSDWTARPWAAMGFQTSRGF